MTLPPIESLMNRPNGRPPRSSSARWTRRRILVPFLFIVGCGGGPVSTSINELLARGGGDRTALKAAALIDEHRATLGCPPLSWNASVARVAGKYSRQMSEEGFFSHVDPDGTTLRQRLEGEGVTGHRRIAETIAAGQNSPSSVVNAWLNSPGHRGILEDCGLHEIGVGFHEGSGRYRTYWTAIFVTFP